MSVLRVEIISYKIKLSLRRRLNLEGGVSSVKFGPVWLPKSSNAFFKA